MQRRRRTFQVAFFALFLLAPALDLLRFDLNEAQLWFLGQRWTLGIDAFRAGQIGAGEMAANMLWRAFLPAIAVIAVFLGVAWKYGRMYCGWLCPHFSLVELLNDTLQRACGRTSLWDRQATPVAGRVPQRRWWPVFAALCLGFGFLWAITLLTYLLPPAQIWGNLVAGTLTPNQARFIGIGTLVFAAEFGLARHFFCRFGCAVGLFQSLVWMANPHGRVVGFPRGGEAPPRSALRRALTLGLARARPSDCRTCDAPRGNACDHACPMHLNPRQMKRRKFSCVQCGLCVDACDHSQQAQQREPLLHWAVGADALRETLRARRERPADASADNVLAFPVRPDGERRRA
ncbi:4Fe-4S binding protein [Ideonella sp.]|uniref:4Fe-4S binding protein n=1 Tax=Ideonella sp. TaxID=1929293 RepID=UPI0035B09C9D